MKTSLHINKAKGIIWIIGIIVFSIILSIGNWKKASNVISWDVQEYYSYVTATLIHHDYRAEHIPPNLEWHYWDKNFPKDKRVFRFSMGMSILYTPFFLMAHTYAHLFGYDTMGYSEPYAFFLQISSLFYLIIGLIFLRKTLLRYFDTKVVGITLFLVVIGTNILYYTGIRSAVTHAYSFSLYAIFIYLTILWHEKPKWSSSIFLGLLTGMISLIRPTNSIVILIFILYGIFNRHDIREKVKLFKSNYSKIILIAFLTILVWTPQMLYWYSITGQFFYYSYGSEEKFFFSNPQVLRAVFGYRNGWLVYTPIMIFALAGIVLLRKRLKTFFIPVLIFTLLNIYLVTSWWCWWYVGYGNRAFIDSYALLSIPLASFITYILESKKIIKYIFVAIAVFLIYLNCFQVWQFKKGYMHHDGMTKEAYWFLFLNSKPRDGQWQYFKSPDYEKARHGIFAFAEKKK